MFPGQATAYMVGRLGILQARNFSTSALGKKFSLKDFHYQVLEWKHSEFGHENVSHECEPDREILSRLSMNVNNRPIQDYVHRTIILNLLMK